MLREAWTERYAGVVDSVLRLLQASFSSLYLCSSLSTSSLSTLKHSRCDPCVMSELPHSDWQEYVPLGIDYGTGFLKLATQHIYPGRRQNAKDIYDVRLDSFNCAAAVPIEQVAIWTEGRNLIWGKRPVDRWLRDHPNEREVLISAWKLALMDNFKDREVVQSTVDALGCTKDRHSITSAVEAVITEHLRQIKSEALKWCKEKSPANMSRQPDWDNLPWVSWSTSGPIYMLTELYRIPGSPTCRSCHVEPRSSRSDE